MEADKKFENMEKELKLLKGEVKQSLASVRDYLLNMELPASEYATILAQVGGASEMKVTMQGDLATTAKRAKDAPEEPPEEPENSLFGSPEEEDEHGPENNDRTETEPLPEEQELLPEDELPLLEEESEEGIIDLSEYEPPLEEEQSMTTEKITAETNPSTPRVNLLANLMGWVTKAKKDIGSAQLPMFLEVYGISGHLSDELKEIILQLAEIASDKADPLNTAEVWSQSMLTLHGILTGGDAPLYTPKPLWPMPNDETAPNENSNTPAAEEKEEESPVKLKLVFPNGGKSKEYFLDLNPTLEKE